MTQTVIHHTQINLDMPEEGEYCFGGLTCVAGCVLQRALCTRWTDLGMRVVS